MDCCAIEIYAKVTAEGTDYLIPQETAYCPFCGKERAKKP